jgi:hypothetical protein
MVPFFNVRRGSGHAYGYFVSLIKYLMRPTRIILAQRVPKITFRIPLPRARTKENNANALLSVLAEREGFEHYMFSTLIGCILSMVESISIRLRIHATLFSKAALSLPPQSKRTPCGVHALRRERDSNPRRAFTLNSFQDCRLQPLSHPSVIFNCLFCRWLKISSTSSLVNIGLSAIRSQNG